MRSEQQSNDTKQGMIYKARAVYRDRVGREGDLGMKYMIYGVWALWGINSIRMNHGSERMRETERVFPVTPYSLQKRTMLISMLVGPATRYNKLLYTMDNSV